MLVVGKCPPSMQIASAAFAKRKENFVVFISMDKHIDYENHKVFFPLCESSGGDLHGWWTFTDNTHFYPYPGNGSYYGVQVESGRIVIAWPISLGGK